MITRAFDVASRTTEQRIATRPNTRMAQSYQRSRTREGRINLLLNIRQGNREMLTQEKEGALIMEGQEILIMKTWIISTSTLVTMKHLRDNPIQMEYLR